MGWFLVGGEVLGNLMQRGLSRAKAENYQESDEACERNFFECFREDAYQACASISRVNAWNFQTEGGSYPRKMELQEEPICLHMQNLHRMKFSELIFIITCLWKNGNFSIKAKGVPLWKYWKNHCFFGIESYNWN